jgi:hypothetical protein
MAPVVMCRITNATGRPIADNGRSDPSAQAGVYPFAMKALDFKCKRIYGEATPWIPWIKVRSAREAIAREGRGSVNATGGYAEGFLREWWDTWVARGEMAEGYRLTAKAEATLLGRLATITGPEVHKPA